MKIILCIFLLNITAVSVFGQSVELNDIVGQSVKFPAAVEKGGYLMYGTLPIGDSSLETPGIGNYRGRLDWDICTGLFSLSGLKMEDIGEYKVHNKDQNITVFQLNVYKDNVNVSKPHVSITHNEYPCTIECTAERGTEATLSWYREGQKKPYSRSSVRSAPHLDLPQTVERSGTYTCEAKNSVSNEKASITVGAHCTAPTSPSTIVVSVIAAVALLIVFGVLCYYIIRSRQAVRTLIEVKKLLDNVVLQAYDETDPPIAVTLFIRVKEQLDNVDPHAYGVRSLRQGVRTLRRVKMLLDNVDLHDFGETMPPLSPDDETVPPDGETSLELSPDDETVPPDGETSLELSPDAVRTLIEVKELLDDLDLLEYD